MKTKQNRFNALFFFFFLIIVILFVYFIIKINHSKNVDISLIPSISNNFVEPDFGYINTFDDYTVYIGYDKASNWKMTTYEGNRTSLGYISLDNEMEEIKIVFNLVKTANFFENEKYYVFKKEIELNGYKGILYINRNGEANLFITIDSSPNELYLWGKITKNNISLPFDEQEIISDINSIKNDYFLLEESNIQSILKTITYKNNGKVKTNNNHRYIKLGNTQTEEYNIALIESHNPSTKKSSSVSPKNRVNYFSIDDHDENDFTIFIEGSKIIRLDYSVDKEETFLARYTKTDLFNTFVTPGTLCVGTIINKEKYSELITMFNYYDRLSKSEYNTEEVFTIFKETNTNDIKGFLYIDNRQQTFFHILCIDDESELYLLMHCYCPTQYYRTYDFEMLYNNKKYQTFLQSIKIMPFTYMDYEYRRFVKL